MNFLNDSFKTLKNVLEEKISSIEEDTSENDTLRKLCSQQLEEIELLRKQIYEYQQAKLDDTRTLLLSEKQQQNANNKSVSQELHEKNDSWLWEQETNIPLKDETNLETEPELMTVSLESNHHEVIENLRQQLKEEEKYSKRLSFENSVLNEKLKNLNAENQELNKSIEELDLQHQIAIEKVLDVKNSIQSKLNGALEEIKSFDQQKDELIKKYHNALDAKDAEKINACKLIEKLKAENQQLMKNTSILEEKVEEYVETIQSYESEISDLKTTIKASKHSNDTLFNNNDTTIQKIISMINSHFKQKLDCDNEEHFMETISKWMSSTSLKIREMDFEISKLIDENKHIKDEATKHVQERDALKSELINYEIECSELMKNNKILRADIENLRMNSKLETIIENDDDEEIDGMTTSPLITSNSKKDYEDDEFCSIKSKLDATEAEHNEYLNQIKSLKNQLSENVELCKSYQEEIENLENEKCNYLFELNELKSEEERNVLLKELKYYKDQESELFNKIDAIEKVKDDILRKYNELENSTLQQASNEDDASQKLIIEKENELLNALGQLERLKNVNEHEIENVKSQMTQKLIEKDNQLKELEMQKESLLIKNSELIKVNSAYFDNLEKANHQVQDLQRKLIKSTDNDDELKSKIKTLEESSSKYLEGKNNLDKQIAELIVQNQCLEETIQKTTTEIEHFKESLQILNEEKESLRKSTLEMKQDKESLTAQIESLLTEKQALITENNLLLTKYEDIKKVNESNVESVKTSNQLIQELQVNLSKTTDVQELNSKIVFLEECLNILTKEKETIILENQSLVSKCNELSKYNDTILENLRNSNELVRELEIKLEDLKNMDELKAKIVSLEKSAIEFTKEKEGLIHLVTTKHNENVQYHNEILRLNQLLQDEIDKNKSTKNEAIEQFNDQMKFLREKCDLLAQNLLQEQNSYRLLQQEKNDAIEMNNTLNKDIERLRQHLLEVADAYTFEQVSLQKQVEDYKGKLLSVEAEAKQSATAYTSANIRANQQAETLQAQYNLLIQQRDELLTKLSAAEDNDNKNQAAITNLQIALEIFQRDKENDIEYKTAALQKQLEIENSKQMKLHSEINQLQSQLQEAKNGLMAAARLSDQLELNQLTIEKLNNDIISYQKTILSLKTQLEASSANTSNADIDLIKNLIVGYVTAPNTNAKNQILKLISNVLNLSESECVKIGLKSGATGGWFSKASNDNLNNNVSITEAFVAFLEKESQPRVNANLLTIHEKETVTASRKLSTSSGGPDIACGNTPENSAPISENTLLTSYSSRNSSSILKDILQEDET